MTKLFTGEKKLSKGSFYFGVNQSLWGKSTLTWIDGVLQIPTPNIPTNDDNTTIETPIVS